MAKFTGVSLQTLNDRLGQPTVKRRSGNSERARYFLLWQCNGPHATVCSALAEAIYVPTPPNLTAREQELFDNMPCPEHGWTFTPCPKHHDDFTDYPEQPD